MPAVRITDALSAHAVQRPDALATADARRRLSWAELDSAVAAMSADLIAKGLQVGDRVAVIAPDGVDALVVILAVLRCGAVHAPIDHSLADVEMSAGITLVQATWVLRVHADGHLACDASGLPHVADPLAPEESAFIRLTSGTTGTAKGVLLSHASLIARVRAANRGLNITADDRVLWLLPMAYHVAVSILLYIDVGAAIIFGNRLRSSDTATCAREHQCTLAYASPWHVRRLADLPAGSLPSTLQRIISTTTALDALAAGDVRKRHGIPVHQALGIIECGLPLFSAGTEQEPVGRFEVTEGFSARVIAMNGQDAALGSEGELMLAGPGFLDAYLTPWCTRAALLSDGKWFHTGDLARIEPDGAVQLLGRSKDLINVGGYKVFPIEVEAVLDSHPAVVASRVFPIHDARSGEQVAAEVQLTAGSDAESTIATVKAWCSDRLAPLKRPAQLTVVAQLAMTASGKVKR
jgi:long-chain acyl-CoA synthetase